MQNQRLTPVRVETDQRKSAVYFFFFILPFLLFLLFFVIIRKNPLDFRLVFSDELDYWVEATTLAKRGLFSPNAGYFGYSFGNHARFLYFGAHGFFSLIPSALFGYFAPRAQVTVLVMNALLMGISLSTAYYMIGSFQKILTIALLLFGFYPFYLYYQTGMIETLFYAGSIFLAALCAKCFASGSRQGTYLKLYFWLVVIFSLFRLSNFVLIIPAFFIEIHEKKQKLLILLLRYAVVALLVTLFSIVFAASYPWGFLGELDRSGNVLGLIVANTISNLKLLFDLSAGYSLEITPRFLYFSWLIFLCIYYFSTKKHNTKKFDYFLISQILALLALLLLNITLYDIGSFRDLRVFSPILTFSMMGYFLFGQGKNSGKWVFALTVIFLLASNFVIAIERDLAWDLFIARRYEASDSPSILTDINFNSDAISRWENTVYVDLRSYGQLDWRDYDPGIGLMVLNSEEIERLKSVDLGQSLKARYIIAQESMPISGYKLIKSEQNTFLYLRNYQ